MTHASGLSADADAIHAELCACPNARYHGQFYEDIAQLVEARVAAVAAVDGERCTR